MLPSSRAVSIPVFAEMMDSLDIKVPNGVYCEDFDYHAVIRDGRLVGGMVMEYYHSGVRAVWFDTTSYWVDDDQRCCLLRVLMREYTGTESINWVGIMLDIEDRRQHPIMNELMQSALRHRDLWVTGNNAYFRLWPNRDHAEFRCCRPVIRKLSVN